MYQVMLIRPGTTDYDDQRRIKGRLDIPLNEKGVEQVAEAVQPVITALAESTVKAVYSAPCQSAAQTAEMIAKSLHMKSKKMPGLTNLNPGLWQGKLIEEVKQQHPKIYRRWQEQPETVCPPEGEMIADARRRLLEFVEKIAKKARDGVAIVVAPEPVASVLQAILKHQPLGDLWQAESNCGNWELIRVETEVSV